MPHSFLLRAEASYRLGQKRHAIADLSDALDISPKDVQANRRMLAWATGSLQQTAARALLSSDRDVNVLRQALDVLDDQARTTYASMNVFDRSIEGWAVWDRDAPLEVSIVSRDGTTAYYLEPDPFHALSNQRTRAANFNLSRPRSNSPQAFAMAVEGHRFFSMRAAGNEPGTSHREQGAVAAADAGPTVMVPIYADFAATKACLDSLFEAIRQLPDCRAILVDDATPDHRIKGYLAGVPGNNRIEILTNPQNLGFVGSINRALGRVHSGDVILLNSDTVVPPGFIERLAATAHSSPDIGTVIPLSNNGEFSSFPIPNRSNELGSLEDVILLDQIAACANRGIAVDIPSGIGFCLYVTRACLDAVGPLSESYQRGYLEDVDFCLRARERGFRSVCAPSVYVGHAGSRSFKGEKRSLVIRNLDVLDAKFPAYRNECSAFMIADPIRSSRERLERRLPIANDHPRLIVSGEGSIAAVALNRAHQLRSQNQPAMLLHVDRRAPGMVVKPVGLDQIGPQNIEFSIAGSAELSALEAYLDDLRPACIEIWDPAAIPDPLLGLLVDGRARCELAIADAGIVSPHPWCLTELIPELATDRQANPPARASDREPSAWQLRWRAIAAKAEAVIAPGPAAAAFARRHLGSVSITEIDQPPGRPNRRWKKPSGPARRLGVLPLRTSAEELRMMRSLVRSLNRIRSDLSITVVGETLDDLALMKSGNCFVTGPVVAADVDRILTQYALEHLLIGVGAPLFGHPIEIEAVKSGLPVARFDWSSGQIRARDRDAAIDPAMAHSEIARSLVDWMEGH